MTRACQHLMGAVRDALEAYPAGPLSADAGEAAFHAKALQRFDALAQARDVALPPGVSIAWSRRFGLPRSLLPAEPMPRACRITGCPSRISQSAPAPPSSVTRSASVTRTLPACRTAHFMTREHAPA
ncbi:hypothetical protein ABFU55_01060 [Xanthomonas campestris pv. raphani]|uniref:hypothetical protein n=1 Tax=Xanthomonas campestris TaxID=339 RepID=UPI003890E94D